MITKKEIYCLKLVLRGPFYEEYLCCLDRNDKKKFFNTRVMKKSQITRNSVDSKMIKYELLIRSKLRHSFLTNQICAFQDYENLYYVTEAAPICLFDKRIFPEKFTLIQSRFYISELFLVLKYLNSKNQHYNFLCPNNILIGIDGHIKLDYSFCNNLEINDTGIFQNIEYTSLDYVFNRKFSHLSDYWSMGVLLYKMVFGSTPFTGKNIDKTVQNMICGKISFPDDTDENLKSFILLLLDPKNFFKKKKCKEIEEEIVNHSFFKNIDWRKIEEKSIEPPYVIKEPNYNLFNFPKLSSLYTSILEHDEKDGFGDMFLYYNTVHFIYRD